MAKWSEMSTYQREFIVFGSLWLLVNPILKATGNGLGYIAELVGFVGLIQLLIRYVIYHIKSVKKSRKLQ